MFAKSLKLSGLVQIQAAFARDMKEPCEFMYGGKTRSNILFSTLNQIEKICFIFPGRGRPTLTLVALRPCA